LIEREPSNAIGIFQETLRNNQSFGKQSGDIIFGTDICSEIYQYCEFLNQNRNLISKLDSIIIYKIDTTHFLHHMALNNKSYVNEFNERIVELALYGNNKSAIFYIDKHNIQIDNLMFKESIEYILENVFIGIQPENKMRAILAKLE